MGRYQKFMNFPILNLYRLSILMASKSNEQLQCGNHCILVHLGYWTAFLWIHSHKIYCLSQLSNTYKVIVANCQGQLLSDFWVLLKTVIWIRKCGGFHSQIFISCAKGAWCKLIWFDKSTCGPLSKLHTKQDCIVFILCLYYPSGCITGLAAYYIIKKWKLAPETKDWKLVTE